MRLVACPNCRTHLDLSNSEANSIRCRCGEIVENRSPDGLDLEINRCSACGGSVAEGADECEYCGSDIVRNRRNLSMICPGCYARNADCDRFCSGCGLHFEPVEVDTAGEELLCPDCEMPLTGHVVGDVRIRECASCNGLWVPEERFELLMAKAVESQKKLDADTTERLKPRIRGANPARQKVLYRSCLVCKQQMQRRNFRKTSGVIIDRCNQHGTWLDADELERISGFLISGGRPMADWYLRNEAATAQKTVLRPAYNPPAPTVQLQRSRHFPVRRQRDTGGLGGLMRIFAELLD